MATTKKSVFETLSKVDVSAHLEKKGQFTYLSWAWAVMTLLNHYPNSTWKVLKWGVDGCRQPYMKTEAGAFVQVTVSVEGVDRTQVHPVLDHKNNTVAKPNSFQINTSIQRCLAKAIALHGLGLYIFRGEDLPESKPLNEKQLDVMDSYLRQIADDAFTELVNSRIDANKINDNNYNDVVSKLKSKLEQGEKVNG